MARTIAPTSPTPIKANLVNPPKTAFEQMDTTGDALIDAANNEFKLATSVAWKAQSAEAYNKFQNDPVRLTAALAKIQDDILPDDMPESLKESMRMQMYLENVELATKAENNRQEQLNKTLKQNGSADAALTQGSMETAFGNLLAYYAEPDETKRRPIDLDIYKALSTHMGELANLKDTKGNDVFSETEQKELRYGKNIKTAAFKTFINGLSKDGLKEFDEKVFQDERAFKNNTGLDTDTYNTMSSYIQSRYKALDIANERQIKTQAEIDIAKLVTTGDQTIADKIDKSGYFGNAGKQIIKAAQESIQKYSYDPNKPTDPTSSLKSLSALSGILSNQDFSKEGRERAITQGAKAMIELGNLAQEGNIDPETYEKLRRTVAQAIANETFVQNISVFEPSTFIEHLGLHFQDFAKSLYGIPDTESIRALQQNPVLLKELETRIFNAMGYAANGMPEAMQQEIEHAKYAAAKYRVRGMIAPEQLDVLQKQLENKEHPTYYYKGMTYEYKGVSDAHPMFVLKI